MLFRNFEVRWGLTSKWNLQYVILQPSLLSTPSRHSHVSIDTPLFAKELIRFVSSFVYSLFCCHCTLNYRGAGTGHLYSLFYLSLFLSLPPPIEEQHATIECLGRLKERSRHHTLFCIIGATAHLFCFSNFRYLFVRCICMVWSMMRWSSKEEGYVC